MPNILYLLCHKRLTDYEVPILIKKGYPCFIPKNFNGLDMNLNSLSTGMELYDNFLDIPASDIKILNSIEWFNPKYEILDIHIELIQKHFHCIFITLLHDVRFIRKIRFKRPFYLRLFGREYNHTYMNMIRPWISECDLRLIFSYQEIINFEKEKFPKEYTEVKHYYVPLGLSNTIVSQILDTYNPVIDKVVFVCAKIKSCKYYTIIYDNFKTLFKDIPYTILGHQNDGVKDDTVKINISDSEFYNYMSKHICMYYHGVEPRHLHYHPLEAVIIGIPVIFYRKSLLNSYLKDSPGCCDTPGQAISLVKRLLSGDTDLCKSIIHAQNMCRDKLYISSHTEIFQDIL